MAHFAKLGVGNIVERVEVVSNDIATDETAGKEFLRTLYNEPHGQWIQTSYNQNFRKNYAGIGFKYDATKDAFIPPKPYNSWTLDEEICQWLPPIPKPDYEQPYEWNEKNQSWDLVE